MNKNRFLTILSICVLINCGNKTSIINDDDVVSIQVPENAANERILYSTLFDSMKYVALETSDEVLIEKLTKIKVFKNKIFVLDEGTQSIFVFGMDGKLIWKINNVGRGPKEYYQLTDFDIDEENNRLLLFSFSDKIQIYDIEGNFIEEYRTRLRGLSFAVTDNKIYFYTGVQSNFIGEKKWNYNLLILDSKGNVLRGEIPIKKELDRTITYNLSNSFYKYDGEIHFFMPFSNNIYSIKNDSIHKKYYFDFGKYNLPDNYFDYHPIDDLSESGYAYGLNSYWVNQKYCCFRIQHPNEGDVVLYSKRDEKIYRGHLYDDIAYCSPVIFQATDEFILGAHQAEDIFMIKNYRKEDRPVMDKIVSEIAEDDNPVIFFYYFK
jgi:hypothetical protein